MRPGSTAPAMVLHPPFRIGGRRTRGASSWQYRIVNRALPDGSKSCRQSSDLQSDAKCGGLQVAVSQSNALWLSLADKACVAYLTADAMPTPSQNSLPRTVNGFDDLSRSRTNSTSRIYTVFECCMPLT
jgi:hypothetical protein